MIRQLRFDCRSGLLCLFITIKHLPKKDTDYEPQLIYYNVQILKAHFNYITNYTADLSSHFVLLGKTWATSLQHFELSGFEEMSHDDNQGTTPRASCSLCFVKKHLIEDRRVSSKHATMVRRIECLNE